MMLPLSPLDRRPPALPRPRSSTIPGWMVACLCLMLVSSGRVCAQEAAVEIKWLRSAELAAETAKVTGKPILVYVRSASCYYCDLMQTHVWQDPTAAAIVMRDFVPLKLTREENAEAVASLEIKGFPATMIFSADRQYVDRLDGYVDAERFLAAVSKMRLAASSKSEIRQR